MPDTEADHPVEAAPDCSTFGTALEAMRSGSKARRRSWPGRWFILVVPGGDTIRWLGSAMLWTPEPHDLLAKDWMVMP